MHMHVLFTDLVHSRVGEQQCWVIMGNDTAGVNIAVLLGLDEVVYENVPYLS